MEIKSNKRSLLQRVLGKPATPKPETDKCWKYDDGKLIIALTDASELQSPGGALRLEGKNLPVRVLITHGEDGEYRAYHNRCTHFGHRRLDPVPGTDTVQCCSVNKSIFDIHGKPFSGPAAHSITSYPVELKQDTIVVSIA